MTTKTLLLMGLLFMGTFSFAGCSKDDSPASGKAGTLGEITADRTRFGLEQPISFTCPATVGENLVEPSGITWVYPSGLSTDPVTPADGKVTLDYTPEALGAQTVQCISANYGTNLDERIVKSFKFNVVACDVRNSFWGDSQAETERNQPSLTASSSDANVLLMTVTDEAGILQSKNPQLVAYGFQRGQLTNCEQSVTYSDNFTRRYLARCRELGRSYTSQQKYDILADKNYKPADDVMAVLQKMVADSSYVPSADECKLVDPQVAAGNLSFEFTANNEVTHIKIDMGTSGKNDGQAALDILFTKKD